MDWNFELTHGSFESQFQSFMRSTWKAALAVTLGVSCAVEDVGKTWTRASGSFVSDGFAVGDRVRITGFVNAGNNVTGYITTLTADVTYNFLPGRFSPFVTGGIGWSWVDTNIATEPPQTGCWWDPWWGYVCTSFQDTKTIDGFSYQVGVGARYDFSDALAVKGSYKMTWIDFDKADGTPDFDGFTLSVAWKF
jgi:opacity protein-like surface antigen